MDLSRYDRKKVRIRTEDGKIFAGRADVYPSGYGLHEFNRQEESIRIRRTYIFLSEIKTIDVIPDRIVPSDDPDRYDDLLDYLVNDVPCWIADILPRQVPKDADGQYFAVDRYFRQPENGQDGAEQRAEDNCQQADLQRDQQAVQVLKPAVAEDGVHIDFLIESLKEIQRLPGFHQGLDGLPPLLKNGHNNTPA